MIQINDLTITHKKDLNRIVEHFQLVLNDGDKAVIIGEEGDGKSTIMKWMVGHEMIEDYAEWTGRISMAGEVIGYLPQELSTRDRAGSVYEYLSSSEAFWDQTPKELAAFSKQFGLPTDLFYSDRTMNSLSGGEKIKIELIRILMGRPTALLLDEPSNDLDIATLEFLERLINDWPHIVLFISHDETLIENTANTVIHLERPVRKRETRFTVAHVPYLQYVEDYQNGIERQMQQAKSDLRDKRIRDEKYRRISQSVEAAQASVSRQDPSTGRLLKKKMHTVKALGKRFEREDSQMTEKPRLESPISFTIGDESVEIPWGKTVLDFSLDRLHTKDGSAVLAENVVLTIRGPEKVCITGANGSGKTTLIGMIARELLDRKDITAVYMPQIYEEELDMTQTPIEFLVPSGEIAKVTWARTCLGAMRYTTDEMEHPMSELSGGQKAKVLFLKLNLSGANVLILDEPTRNFSPLSGNVIRSVLAGFPGTVISISHDRKYINEVSDRVLELTKDGLRPVELPI